MTLPAGLTVAVRTPASSANLGPGFDTIGLALGVYDDYELVVEGSGLLIEVEGQGADAVPRDERHLVFRCLAAGLGHLGMEVPAGLRLRCTNRVPHSRGMGSSATAIVSGFALASALACLARTGRVGLDLDDINDLAGAWEGHPDNSSASVYGAMTISWSQAPPAVQPVRTAVLAPHPDIAPVVLVPGFELSTATARAALAPEVSLKAASLGAGRAALLVESMTRRPDLLLPATQDFLHQEPRRGAYPHSMALVDELRAAGHAAVISGAGPTVLVLTTDPEAVAARPLPDGWRALTPGVAPTGVTITG